MTNLNEYKDLKQAQLIYKELIEAQTRLTTSIDLLKDYSKYVGIQESLSVLHNTRTLIEINLNKYKKIVNGKVD